MSDSTFKAIADANRRKILQILKGQHQMSAGEIATHFDFSKATLSEHLKILRQANLISAQRRGQFIYYSLNTSVFEEILNWIYSLKK